MPERSDNPTPFALYLRELRANRKAERVAILGGRCTRCGATENLQFDHVDPKTKIPGAIDSHDPAVWKEEIKKCQLLCFPCHLEKSRLESIERTGEWMRSMTPEEKKAWTERVIAGSKGKTKSAQHRTRISEGVLKAIAEGRNSGSIGGRPPSCTDPSDGNFIHGRASAYRYCHCRLCKDAHAERMRKYVQARVAQW